MANFNINTGIPFGYVQANHLDSDVVNDLQMSGKSLDWDDAVVQHAVELGYNDYLAEADYVGMDVLSPADWLEENHPGYEDSIELEEERHAGTLDGVSYATSWLGGALHVFVFESPYAQEYLECSPCVPGAHNVTPDAPVFPVKEAGDRSIGYSVPADWFNKDEF